MRVNLFSNPFEVFLFTIIVLFVAVVPPLVVSLTLGYVACQRWPYRPTCSEPPGRAIGVSVGLSVASWVAAFPVLVQLASDGDAAV